ncbi:Calx-beta domain-containing protein [Chroococcus sp. FPU101]|uniref:beta strand repeat-containing protein n=1 Tax=Chroococcus sp. FPU101 TaxID=1974212 RepID=UPI001A9061B5|nr:Calx-beta domain-containing protein [Chroococcus sp. FPU101]GFE71566.1 hypothetical protein CFPU101_41760 [Chroococcus sp. FPU101]
MPFPAVFNLSSLNGTNGFAINGINAYDQSGRSVSNAGDINGDGFDDLIIGAPYADPNSSLSGQSYVVFGKSGGFSASFNLSTLNGTNGFALNGIFPYGISGFSVSSAGDVNGDGFDDLIIGTRDEGQSYVVFGKSSGFSASLNLSTTLNGTNGFALNGINSGDGSGRTVSSAGDINGDGFDDLIIGAFRADPNGYSYSYNTGQSYVVFGKSDDFSPSINLSTLNGTNGFAINGLNSGDALGWSVSSAGDVNGDGFDDILIGAPNVDLNGYYSGQSYVVFGKSGGFGASFDLSTLNGTNGFAINGISERDYLGWSVSNGGDVNGDGFDDILIGARGAAPNGNYSGQSYVVFGKSGGFNPNINLSTLNGANGFAINGINFGDASGYSVSSAGDVNGDGFDDILIGAYNANPNSTYTGQSYVVFGKNSGFSASFDLSTLNGTNGFAVNGINTGDGLGWSVSSAGDINGDGFDDIIIGAIGADPNGSYSGQSYVIFGQSTTTLPNITLAVSPASVTEDGTGNLIYTFTRTGSLTSPLTVNYGITGTATRGTDYANIATSVTFAANSSTAQVIVNPTPDTTVEPNETVALTLASNAAYTIGTTSPVIGTILNDDVLPTVTLAVSPASVTEDGTANLVYTFTRTGVLTSSLNVNYGITGTATNGTDYANIGTSVTFAANSNTAQVIVNPTADTVVESNETVALTLASNAAYTIGTTGAVTGTITNDDTATPNNVTLALNYSGISENSPTNFTYTFTRTGNLTNSLVVNFNVSGDATFSTDYLQTGANFSSPTKTITFAKGASTANVVINPVSDSTVESNESVILQLTSGTGYGVGTSSAVTATIINDDGTRRQIATNGSDVILGRNKNDVIIGGGGNDILTGGANADLFTFSRTNEGIDRITDFTAGDDLIVVKASGFGGGLTANDVLKSNQFIIGSSATTTTQRFIYNNATGALLFDRDGTGTAAAIQFATLNTGLALTNEDIFVS